MFKKFTINGIPSGMTQDNYPPTNNYYFQDPYNGLNNPPPISYGYPYGEPTYNYVPPVQDVTVNQVAYKLDPLSDTWGKEISNNKGKVKVQPLTSSFNIISRYKNNTPDGKLRFVIIEYFTKGKSYTALMPAEDYIKDLYHKYLKEIFRYPGCTRNQFNELVAFLLQTAPSQDITIFSHQGWNDVDNGALVFASEPPQLYIPHSLLSPSIKRRKLSPMSHSPQEIIQNWLNIYSKNPSLNFMGYFRIGSLFQYFLRKAGLNVQQYIICEPSETLGEDKLKVMLATNDIVNFKVPSLDSGEDKILKELELVFDGICLFTDDSFADEENKILLGLKTITKAVRQDAVNTDFGNGLIAVISKNAAFAATRLAPNNVIVIDTDSIEIEADADWIKAVTDEMDTLVITTVLSHVSEVKALITNRLPDLRKDLSEKANGESLDTLTMLVFVELFFKEFLNFRMLNDETLNNILQTIDCKSDRVMDASHAIENDFSSIISEMIRSKSIVPVRKRRNMRFENDGKSFIIDGERMYLPSEIVKSSLALMTTVHSSESLMKALKRTNALEYKEGNTHRVELHDNIGKHQHLYLYDISAEILDADVLYKLHNLESDAFLLKENEIPQNDFISLLNDGQGHIAGKQICYNNEENGHCYITGQSGWGKTYLLSQLVAKCFTIGHRVVIFDSSDSFTYEAMCHNLSKNFVDKNVTIFDLDKDGIPIDFFRIDRNAGLTSLKKLLLGVLQAGIGELSPPQSNALRSILSSIISELDENDRITCQSIINKLKGVENKNDYLTLKWLKDYLEPLLNEIEQNGSDISMLDKTDRKNCQIIINKLNGRGSGKSSTTFESLLNRLEPLFEDIEECEMADKSWGEFFRTSNKIIVIRTDSAYTESGNQIIDMMLATLYNYQHDNPQLALDVFIDELQNQNFSKTSAICKAMKEGRKNHMSFFGATQDYYPRNTELGSVMGKAGTQIFLRPTPNSGNVIASELRFNKADMSRFDNMQRGDIIVKGNLFSKEYGRNVPVILSGHVDDFPKIPKNYYGNVL